MMSPENQAKSNANVRAINAMTDEALLEMFKQGKCPFEPEHLIGVPLGQFHCEVCGLMVVAGVPHGPFVWHGDLRTGHADFPDDEIPKENGSPQSPEGQG